MGAELKGLCLKHKQIIFSPIEKCRLSLIDEFKNARTGMKDKERNGRQNAVINEKNIAAFQKMYNGGQGKVEPIKGVMMLPGRFVCFHSDCSDLKNLISLCLNFILTNATSTNLCQMDIT